MSAVLSRFVDDVPVVLHADPNAAGRPVTRVGDIMTSVPITADAAMSVDEAGRLMLEHGVTVSRSRRTGRWSASSRRRISW